VVGVSFIITTYLSDETSSEKGHSPFHRFFFTSSSVLNIFTPARLRLLDLIAFSLRSFVCLAWDRGERGLLFTHGGAKERLEFEETRGYVHLGLAAQDKRLESWNEVKLDSPGRQKKAKVLGSYRAKAHIVTITLGFQRGTIAWY
jgi:hypothetical protein